MACENYLYQYILKEYFYAKRGTSLWKHASGGHQEHQCTLYPYPIGARLMSSWGKKVSEDPCTKRRDTCKLADLA